MDSHKDAVRCVPEGNSFAGDASSVIGLSALTMLLTSALIVHKLFFLRYTFYMTPILDLFAQNE